MDKKKEAAQGVAQYLPLFTLIIIAALAGLALTWNMGGGMLGWMHFFMGFFFCQFAMLKLFDLDGFADGFQMYDIGGKQSRGYALTYPFIELALGLAYLSFFIPTFTYLITVFVMAFGALGVFQAMQNKLDVKCACMGTVLNVPLSTVTLTEDLGMGFMALIMMLGVV